MGDNYSFLQEKIKDEAGSPKVFRKKIIQMIVCGVIFGIVACFTFFALRPAVSGLTGQDKEEISIPEDEITTESEADDTEKTEEKEDEEAAKQQQKRLLQTLQNVAKDNSFAIVSISGQKKIEKDTEMKRTAGVIIADNGSEILVLCQTLSETALKNLKVKFSDGNEYPAEVKMKDNNIGVGVCAVDKAAVNSDTLDKIKEVNLGNSLIVKSGDPVVLLGSNREDELLVSYGFVASSEEKTEIADGSLELLRVDVAGATFENGILFNQDGEMIGLVNTDVTENKTLVTLYSISDIKNEIEKISNGKGVPYIGIWGVALPDALKSNELENGICVKEIDTDSPAMEAGIQCGDILTQIGDEHLSNMEEFRNILLKQNVKEIITIKGFRKGADDEYVELTFEVQIGQK